MAYLKLKVHHMNVLTIAICTMYNVHHIYCIYCLRSPFFSTLCLPQRGVGSSVALQVRKENNIGIIIIEEDTDAGNRIGNNHMETRLTMIYALAGGKSSQHMNKRV